MYESSRVNVKVEPHSTFTLTCDFSYFASILFTREKYQATVEIHPKAPYSALRFSWRVFYPVNPETKNLEFLQVSVNRFLFK